MLFVICKNILTYLHTINHLKFIQIYSKIWLVFKKTRLDLASAPMMSKVVAPWTAAIIKLPLIIQPNKLSILNQTYDIASSIWNDPKIDKLWLYNLHYLDPLNSKDGLRDSAWCYNFITRWITDNPPAIGCGWEPYPISLRIVNVIKWIVIGNSAKTMILHSLAVQTRYLSQHIELHLLGNHVLANAKALLFAGIFFTGEEAARWFIIGLKLFSTEITEQILSDGGHFELSPMYHSLILEDILDIIN